MHQPRLIAASCLTCQQLLADLSEVGTWTDCNMSIWWQREVLMKELERERQLRIEAENRLRDERSDVCDCKSQATELQKELAR